MVCDTHIHTHTHGSCVIFLAVCFLPASFLIKQMELRYNCISNQISLTARPCIYILYHTYVCLYSCYHVSHLFSSLVCTVRIKSKAKKYATLFSVSHSLIKLAGGGEVGNAMGIRLFIQIITLDLCACPQTRTDNKVN